MCAFARTLPTDAAKCFNCSGSSLSGCRPACLAAAYAHCPSPFAVLFSLLSSPCSLLPVLYSLFSVRHSHSGFTTRHSQSANPLAAAKLSLVVVTHCVLVMRHTQLYRLPLTLHAARLSLVACQLLGVLCQVSMSVSVSLPACLCMCVSVFSITKCQTSWKLNSQRAWFYRF